MRELSELFEYVSGTLSGMPVAHGSSVTLEHQGHTYLQRQLADVDGVPPVELVPGTEFCDLRIGDEIGVRVLTAFPPGTARQLRLLTWRGEVPYDNLVVFAVDLLEEHIDAWRLARSRVDAPGLDRVTFVLQSPDDDSGVVHEEDRSVWFYAEPMVVLTGVLVATPLLLASLPETLLATLVVGALTTVLTALALLSLFGLLQSEGS